MQRLWIYQASRILSNEECARVSEILQAFVQQWTAHGNQLAGSFDIKYNLFILLKVDEEQAMVTGCSIDKSVHLLKKIEQELNIDLFDRMRIAYRSTPESEIQLASRDEFDKLAKAGAVNQDSIVFNNMLTSTADLTSKWEVAMKQSWHSSVFSS